MTATTARASWRRAAPISNRCRRLDTGRDDPALIAFTSGTTGVPKGCVHFHRDILAPCDSFAKHLIGPKPGDIFLTSAPIAFTFGLGVTLLFPLRFGAAAATIEQGGPPLVLEAIAKFGVTHLATAPTAYKAMLSQPALDAALKTLRYCISAGEHLPEATWHAWKDRTGIAITDGIGATEMMHIFVSAAATTSAPARPAKRCRATKRPSSTPPTSRWPKAKAGSRSRGRPAAATSMTRARRTMSKTAGTSPATPTAAIPTATIWYLARTDDMIVSSGYNIGAPEVENALLAHPAVAECAVIGVPCDERGQKVKAFVVLAPISRARATSSPTSSRPSSRTRSPPTNIRARSSSSRRSRRLRRGSYGEVS